MIPKEINTYITKNYYQLLSIAKKYTKNDDFASELLHEVLLQLLEKQNLNIKLDDNSIKYYIIRMLMINWCMPNAPFYRKNKAYSLNQVDLDNIKELTYQQTELDEHELLSVVEIEWSEIDWFNKIIFEKYLVLGSLKKVAIDTTIPLRSIHRYVNDTKKLIKQNAFKKLNN